MGTRENKVERFFDSEFTRIGGVTRKWVCPGRDGVTDRIAIRKGRFWLVEIKTADGVVSSAQEREHQRLRDAGADVRVLAGAPAVSQFIREIERDEMQEDQIR